MQAERRRPTPTRLSWPDLIKLACILLTILAGLVATAVYGKFDARYVRQDDAKVIHKRVDDKIDENSQSIEDIEKRNAAIDERWIYIKESLDEIRGRR